MPYLEWKPIDLLRQESKKTGGSARQEEKERPTRAGICKHIKERTERRLSQFKDLPRLRVWSPDPEKGESPPVARTKLLVKPSRREDERVPLGRGLRENSRKGGRFKGRIGGRDC